MRCSLWGTHQWLPQMLCPPSPQTSAVCLFQSLTHGHPICFLQDPSVWDCHLCVSPAVSPSGKHSHYSIHTHTALPSDSWSLPSYHATCLLLLQRSYSTELSLLVVPTLSPTRSLNSLQSDFHNPKSLPSSLTYMWTPIVCPVLF